MAISLEDIGKIIMGSESTPPYDLKELCTNNKISKWAKWKPIKYTKVGAITDEERENLGYGLVAADLEGAPIGYSGALESDDKSLYTWINNSIALMGKDVIWDVPTEYFRLTDFASEDLSKIFDGSEKATYYMVNGNETYSPALGYYEDISNCISFDDLKKSLEMDYIEIDNMEVVVFYRYNNNLYFKGSGKTVKELKEDGNPISINVADATTVGDHHYEGFMAAVSPISNTEFNGWENCFNNPDAASVSVEVIRFPDSYFSGTYSNIITENVATLGFDENYDLNLNNESTSAIQLNGEVLTLHFELKGDENAINPTITVTTNTGGEDVTTTQEFSNYIANEDPIRGTVEAELYDGFEGTFEDINLKISYNYTTDSGENKTYYIKLDKWTISSIESDFVKVTEIDGIQ